MAFNFKHNAYSFNFTLEKSPNVVQQQKNVSVNVQPYIQPVPFSRHNE